MLMSAIGPEGTFAAAEPMPRGIESVAGDRRALFFDPPFANRAAAEVIRWPHPIGEAVAARPVISLRYDNSRLAHQSKASTTSLNHADLRYRASAAIPVSENTSDLNNR